MQRAFRWKQSTKITVDVHPTSASVFVPREAGLLNFGVRSTYILGLQIGTQFCPGFYRAVAFGEGGIKDRETRLSFFVV